MVFSYFHLNSSDVVILVCIIRANLEYSTIGCYPVSKTADKVCHGSSADIVSVAGQFLQCRVLRYI